MKTKKPPINPWLSGLSELADIEVVREKATQSGEPTHIPKSLLLEERVKKVKKLLDQVYVPTDSGCAFILYAIEIITAFMNGRYPDIRTYISQVNNGFEPTEGTSFICLTGPAGGGKSALISALQRVLPPPTTVFLSPEHRRVPIQRLRRVQVGGKDSNSQILKMLANPTYVAGRGRVSEADAVKHLIQWLYVCGTGGLAIDEMQFLTQGANSNTRVAKLLMSVGFPEVPVIYVVNYSLGHKLKKRPQEERQRLLADPNVLEPDGPRSASWQALIREYVHTLPDLLSVDPVGDAEEIFRMTAGLPRVLRLLIITAMRQLGRKTDLLITVDTLRYAYRSRSFDVHRADVEAMLSLSVSDLLASRRLDLVCPFKGTRTDQEGSSTEKQLNLTGQKYSNEESLMDEEVPLSAQRNLESTLSPNARKTVRNLRKSQAAVTSRKRKEADVRSIRKKRQITEADLYAGADAVRKLSRTSRKNRS
ncbi:MAG: ATP-binding protein [Candidatus Thiodiazotropha endolucinida]